MEATINGDPSEGKSTLLPPGQLTMPGLRLVCGTNESESVHVVQLGPKFHFSPVVKQLLGTRDYHVHACATTNPGYVTLNDGNRRGQGPSYTADAMKNF